MGELPIISNDRRAAIFATSLCALVPVVAILSAYIGWPLRWFSLHPLLMTLGFVAAAAAGILAKRAGGRVNTITHAFSMSAALALALGGWYVIREQKNMLGKPHNTSWHACFGLLALAGYGLGALGGWVALHPDFGVARRNAAFRRAHKWSSRGATAVALGSIVSGWSKLAGTTSTVRAHCQPPAPCSARPVDTTLRVLARGRCARLFFSGGRGCAPPATVMAARGRLVQGQRKAGVGSLMIQVVVEGHVEGHHGACPTNE